MAKTRRRRRRRGAVRRTARRYARRASSSLGLGSLGSSIPKLAIAGAAAAGGVIAAGWVGSRLGTEKFGPWGQVAATVGIAAGIAMIGRKFAPGIAPAMAIGAAGSAALSAYAILRTPAPAPPPGGAAPALPAAPGLRGWGPGGYYQPDGVFGLGRYAVDDYGNYYDVM